MNYPAVLLFDLPEPRRQQVIDAAIELGLAMTFIEDDGIFEVQVPSAEVAYAFGVKCITSNGGAVGMRLWTN